MAEEGNKKAAKLFRLTEQPSRFLATIQVVITLSGFLGSAFAAENFSGRFVSVLVDAGVQIPEKTLDAIAVVLITLLLSYITLIFGELVPKRLAMHNSEKIALGVSGLVTAASKIFAPLVGLLTVSTNGILRLFGIDPNEDDDQVTEEEIRMMGQTVLDYLRAGDVDSAVVTVTDASWMSVMLPKLVIGQRNYRTDSAEIPERITVISDELGQQYTALECATEDERAIYLEITPSEIHYFVCGWQDEKLQGTFSSEILRMEDGAYRKYEGTISADGKVQGSMRVSSGTLDMSAGALQAWQMRNTDLQVYEGEIDGDSETAVNAEQFSVYTMWE